MIRDRLFPLALSLLLLAAGPALAASATDARIERLEKDLNLLQREVYRGEAPTGGEGAPSAGSGNAQAEVRFTAMEEKFRAIQGRLEELEFENRKLQELLERTQKDNELRFQELENASRNAAVAGTEKSQEGLPDEPEKTTEPVKANAETGEPEKVQDTTQPLTLPKKNGGKDKPETARDAYNHAFTYLQQTDYDKAGKAFEAFTKAYPKDALVGNAYYWAGETYYVRQKYVQSADFFRQGFEAMPKGPKAGDNLLKLAMSLGNTDDADNKKKACIVLKQVVAKFGANSDSLKKKAASERSTLGCQ